MKFAIPFRPADMVLIISLAILLGLVAASPAAAQNGFTRLAVPLGDEVNTYAELATVLPSDVESEAYEQKTLNYTGGKDIKTSILLAGSMVSIFLLYPCQPPEAMLDANGLKSLLATADETIMLANYSETELYISGRPAIWGMLDTSLFAAYQPSNQTAALIVMEGSLDEETMYHLLYNMTITVNEGITPITPGYCSKNASVAEESAAIPAESTETGVAAEIASSSTEMADTEIEAEAGAVAQAAPDATPSNKDKAEADMAAAMAQLEKVKSSMRK